MKELKFKKELVSYASAFVSFVITKIAVKEIILFGSAARGEADKTSDIDLFFDVDKDEENIKERIIIELNKFYKSKIAESWILRGVKNKINVHVGKLNEWKLKRSVISDGISLFGRYKELPENMKGYALFQLEPVKDIAKRNKVIRKLFGRKERDYIVKGLVEELNGRKYSASSFIVPNEHREDIIKLFKDEKIDYRFFEFWSDI